MQIRAIDSGKACIIFYDHDAFNEILKLTDTNDILVFHQLKVLHLVNLQMFTLIVVAHLKGLPLHCTIKKMLKIRNIDISSFRPIVISLIQWQILTKNL